MKYTSSPLSTREQAKRILDRGLEGATLDELASILSRVNYHRLSAYWYPFKQVEEGTDAVRFQPGTTLEKILQRYDFDRDLRLLLLEAIERVEITILRAHLVEIHLMEHGPFGYTDPAYFKLKPSEPFHVNLMNEITNSLNRSADELILKFRTKYTDEPYFPIWMVVEVMTFGQLSVLIQKLPRYEQKQLASKYDLFPKVLNSWLHTLNFTRNACAHHARLWNRMLPIPARLPDNKHKFEWHFPDRLNDRRIFIVLAILRYLLRYIDPGATWHNKIEDLISGYPDVPLNQMGFPPDWLNNPVWK